MIRNPTYKEFPAPWGYLARQAAEAKKEERAQVRRARKERNDSGVRQFKALGLHTYEAGTRLSSAYTAGRNGEPHAKHYGGMDSPATKAWLEGHNERKASEQAEIERRSSAYPRLVEALRKANDRLRYIVDQEGKFPKVVKINGASLRLETCLETETLFRELGEVT